MPETEVDETPATTPQTPDAPEHAQSPSSNGHAQPTRQQLYNYARDVLKMDLTDTKTMDAFENMGVSELMKEIDYQPDQITP